MEFNTKCSFPLFAIVQRISLPANLMKYRTIFGNLRKTILYYNLPRVWSVLDLRSKKVCQKEVTQMVDPKVNFKAVFGLSAFIRWYIHSSIVHQNIQFTELLLEVGGKGSD